MKNKEINYIELINENMKKYPPYTTPIIEFMRNVINILDLLLSDDYKSIKYEKINNLAKCLYKELCNENPKWKYEDKDLCEMFADMINRRVKYEENDK